MKENTSNDEDESGFEIEREDPQEKITEPFDPEQIKIRTSPLLVEQLISRIKHKEIDLAPDFQRQRGIWNDERRSRLIESLLLRIPIPVFYVAADEADTWSVVDGVQRMSTMYDFVTGKFPLKRLEYLTWLDGQQHDELPRPMQRRISETSLIVNVIEPGTPPEVMFNVFLRINTGGMTLNGQEIRHALHPGPIRKYLKELAQSSEFKKATRYSIKESRMADRECVLRFLAFHIAPPEQYTTNDLDGYLGKVMEKINRMSSKERDVLTANFKKAMCAASNIFGGIRLPQAYNYARLATPHQQSIIRGMERPVGTLFTRTDSCPGRKARGCPTSIHPVDIRGRRFQQCHLLFDRLAAARAKTFPSN